MTLYNIWTASLSQIYRDLGVLERKGYVSSHIQQQDDRPDKRIYQITPIGKQAFESWLKDFPDTLTAPKRDAFSLRLLFGSRLQREMGAKLWAGAEDIPYIIGTKRRPGIKRVISAIVRIQKPGKINAYPGSGRINEIVVVPTPGHTPGHVCLLFKKVLFLGDLAENSSGRFKTFPPFMTWDITAQAASIAGVNRLQFRWVCPAHGLPVQAKSITI